MDTAGSRKGDNMVVNLLVGPFQRGWVLVGGG